MKTTITALLAVSLSALFAVLLALPGAAALMLLFGVLHHEVSAAVPPIGYAATYPITLFTCWFWTALTGNTAGGDHS